MTEEQKIQELLKPRYKVIADYPDSHFSINDILNTAKDGIRLVSQKTGKSVDWLRVDRFPHLFRKLEWHEERKPEEMPEYVKCIKTPDQIIQPGDILKVKWDNIGGKAENGPWIFLYTNCYLPATSADYNSYISSTDKKEKV